MRVIGKIIILFLLYNKKYQFLNWQLTVMNRVTASAAEKEEHEEEGDEEEEGVVQVCSIKALKPM